MTRTSGQSGKEGSMSDTPARPVSPGRDLPARASLEHLRNEAKAHLRTLRKKKTRSEEHTSELQSRLHLVCRLLLEKKKKYKPNINIYLSPPLQWSYKS